MFAVLAYREEAAGRLCRSFHRIFGEKIAADRTPVGQGECFFTASVTPGTRIRWDDLFVCMGRLSREMVLPPDLEIPDGCGITRFVPAALEPRVVMNTAAALLARVHDPRIPITLVDLRGNLCSMLIPIVRCCASVRVVTENTALYAGVCERLMDEYGASVLVCPPGSGIVRGGVAVLPFGAEQASAMEGSLCIIPSVPDPPGNAIAVQGLGLPEEYQKMCPSGIPELLFGAALYEKCSVREIGALAAESLSFAGKELSFAEAARRIALCRG